MKTNLKSGNAIVRFLLGHGEKIGILAIGVCTALVVWSAIGRERLAHEPAELKDLANQASAHVEQFTWDGLDEESKKIAEPVPESAMAKIPPLVFPNYEGSWDPPVSDPVTLRGDPILLAAVDLEVNADSGLWASADPAVIRRKTLELEKERALKEREREAAREKSLRDPANRRGAAGQGGGYGGEGYGGAAMGGRERKPAKDAPIVERPRTGAQLQGFEEITAKSWVTVLAKIPIDQQTKNYIEALRTSRGYDENVDIPTYLGYQIDRAEITSQGQGEWQSVAIINGKKLLKETSTYPVDVPDVIDPDVKHPLLTHPLPPLILREWGERVSHSSMPLAEAKAMAEAEAMQNPAEEEPKPAGGEEDLFADSGNRRAAGRNAPGEFSRSMGRGGGGEYGRGGGGYGGMGGEYGGGMGGEYGGGMGGEYGGGMGGEYGGGMGGEYGGGYGGYGGGTPGRGSDTTLAPFVWDQETPFVLFRYFDNTVTAGHSYRYRVRLAMQDVNHSVKPQYLDKTVSLRRTESGNKNHRWTDWSEPSPVAGVPMPARIYMVAAKPARETNFNAEPELEILIKALNSEYAAEVARKESFNRGSVVNLIDKATVIWANKIDELDLPDFEFLTGITVLDFTGGEKLSSRNKEMVMPTRALLMNAAGHLFLQDEMEDLETLTEYQAIIEAGKDNRTRGGMGGGYGGGMGEGYGGGYGGAER